MVTMRSLSGMNDERMFSKVVFPAPVPPETMMFNLPFTQSANRSIIGLVSVPFSWYA